MHMRSFPHPFVAAFDIPAVERGGGAGTVAADGASYREIFDVADWDRSLVINTPGQSGQPGSPFYSNLVRDWARREVLPTRLQSAGSREGHRPQADADEVAASVLSARSN